jgi:hypothetical protein
VLVCAMCVGRFPRGVPGGAGMPPLVTCGTGRSPGQRPKIFFGRFLLFLADFSIFKKNNPDFRD